MRDPPPPSTESTVAAERMERRNLLEPLPEPSTFFLRLLSSLFLSVSLSRDLSAWCSLCVFTEIGEAAGCYFPADSCGPAATITDPLALLGTVVPGKTVRPVSSPPYLVSKRGAAGNNNDEESRMKGHSKKDGARGGSMNFRPGKKLPPL